MAFDLWIGHHTNTIKVRCTGSFKLSDLMGKYLMIRVWLRVRFRVTARVSVTVRVTVSKVLGLGQN